MPFVVKVVWPSSVVTWLSEPGLDGFRVMSVRECAEVFQTRDNANSAIATMPQTFAESGLTFSVLDAD
jgi:hypothetical protein